MTSPEPASGPVSSSKSGFLREMRDDPIGFFRGVAQEYPEMARFKVGRAHLTLVSEPRLIGELLVAKNRSFTRTKHRLEEIMGDGLPVLQDHRKWLARRRFLQPLFLQHVYDNYFPYAIEWAERCAADWKASMPSEFHLQREMAKFALSFGSRTLFGVDMNDRIRQISDCVDVLIENLNKYVYAIEAPTDPAFIAARTQFREIVDEIIAERRREIEAGSTRASSKNIVNMLMESRIDGETLSDQDIHDEIMTFYAAGYETVSLSLTWVIHLLTRYPYWQRLIRDEVEAVTGGAPIGFEHVGRFKTLNMVLMESYRLYPPLWRISRTALVDEVIGSRLVPKGETVVACQYLTHRDPRYWERPNEFDPSRFASPSTLQPFTFFPFGGGPRMCIGNNLSVFESCCALATWLRKFEFTADEIPKVGVRPLVVLRPDREIRVGVRPWS